MLVRIMSFGKDSTKSVLVSDPKTVGRFCLNFFPAKQRYFIMNLI